MLEALLFAQGTAAQRVVEAFLRAYADHLAHRALRLVDAVAQPDTQGWLDVEITCVHCGTQNLELWCTGQTWVDALCLPCDEALVAQARPQGR